MGRHASAVLIDRATGHSYAATVDLVRDTVVAWQQLPPGSQPPIMLDEFDECEVNCKRDRRVLDALAGRGMTDLDLVCIEPWSAGYYGGDDQGRRLIRALVYVRNDARRQPLCPSRRGPCPHLRPQPG